LVALAASDPGTAKPSSTGAHRRSARAGGQPTHARVRRLKLRNDIETWSAGCIALALVLLLAWSIKPGGVPSHGAAVSRKPAAPLPRGAAQLPAGIRIIPEKTGFVAREDILAGTLAVPTGRLAVDDYFVGNPQVVVRVPPGRHPVRATVADSVGHPHPAGSVGELALVTVETGSGTPIRWRDAGTMSTDGGLGGFASVETAEAMYSESMTDRLLDKIDAADHDGIAELRLDHEHNLFSFNAGLGDGGYGVYAGIDATGAVTRVVFDGALLHLAWPGQRRPESARAERSVPPAVVSTSLGLTARTRP
jgi:hypothetical protein